MTGGKGDRIIQGEMWEVVEGCKASPEIFHTREGGDMGVEYLKTFQQTSEEALETTRRKWC